LSSSRSSTDAPASTSDGSTTSSASDGSDISRYLISDLSLLSSVRCTLICQHIFPGPRPPPPPSLSLSLSFCGVQRDPPHVPHCLPPPP
jgi:hypothetical protein